MKKLLFLSALITFFATSNYAQAEFGIKGGATFASVGGDDADDTESLTTFHLGGTVRNAIGAQTYFDASLLYTGAGFKLDNSEFDFEPSYIVAPITIRYYASEEFSLFGGLQPGLVINDDDAENLETFDLGLPLGAGYDFNGGLFAEAAYVLGLTDITDNGDLKNRAFRLGIGYMFNQ